jgi:hypothetical protein
MNVQVAPRSVAPAPPVGASRPRRPSWCHHNIAHQEEQKEKMATERGTPDEEGHRATN